MGMRSKKLIIGVILAVIACFAILQMDVNIRQGIDGKYREIHMPLYVKWIEFLSRHYEYARIAKEITAGKTTDEDKALALFKWTHDNIKPVPEGMPRVDDHILNIMIRGYGTSEQAQDVFVNLCVYSKLPAFWQRIYDKSKKVRYSLSFVKIDNKWRVFDAYYDKFFRNKLGEIASVEDLAADQGLLENSGLDEISIRGVPYKEFYENLGTFSIPTTLRSDKQIPLRRIVFEMKKLVGKERE